MTVTVAYILVASSLDPSTYSQTVTFTATVAAGMTGSVTFMDGTTTLGTGTISGSTATYTTSSLAVGLHNITGVYTGGGSHSGATSPVLVQEADKKPGGQCDDVGSEHLWRDGDDYDDSAGGCDRDGDVDERDHDYRHGKRRERRDFCCDDELAAGGNGSDYGELWWRWKL